MAEISLNSDVTTKMLGDAGEHYALSQFIFAGRACAKMPDCWPQYDLAIVSGDRLISVSVKTRSETDKWKSGSWFVFDERSVCDWLVFIFKKKDGRVRSWVIPFEVACENANTYTSARKDPKRRQSQTKRCNRLTKACNFLTKPCKCLTKRVKWLAKQ